MIQHSVQSYATGRRHRLIYTPDMPGTYDVECRVYCPGETRCVETFELKPVDAVYEFYYQFRYIGDYLLVLIRDNEIVNCLKAVVNK